MFGNVCVPIAGVPDTYAMHKYTTWYIEKLLVQCGQGWQTCNNVIVNIA